MTHYPGSSNEYVNMIIVQSEFVAGCIVTSVQHEQQCQWQQTSCIFFPGIAWYYGDNIRTFDLIACLDTRT